MASRFDGGLGSCRRLGPKSRSRGGKRDADLLKLRVWSWNIGSLIGKSIELVKCLERQINIVCV